MIEQEKASQDAVSMHPLPAVEFLAPPFELQRVNRLDDDSYKPSTMPGLLVRELPAADTYGHGKVTAHMLKSDGFSNLGARTEIGRSQGIKLLYIVHGSARYDIDGIGATAVEKGTLLCLPPNNRRWLEEVSTDFEIIEFEFPQLTTSLTSTWAPEGQSVATDAMVDRETSESFRPIPGFDPGIERPFPIVQQMTGGAVRALVLRANPPHPWDGTPWHIHHNFFYCSLMTGGTHVQEYEGFGDCLFSKGDFFVQQGDIRHREITSSMNFEIFTIDLPGVSPASVLLYDEQAGKYQTMMFASSMDIGEAASES